MRSCAGNLVPLEPVDIGIFGFELVYQEAQRMTCPEQFDS
jgi:hypothetical protein